jgi:hypothetical protein
MTAVQVAGLEAVVALQRRQLLQLASQARSATQPSAATGSIVEGSARNDGTIGASAAGHWRDAPALLAAATLLPRWRREALRMYQGKLEVQLALRDERAATVLERRSLARQLEEAHACCAVRAA